MTLERRSYHSSLPVAVRGEVVDSALGLVDPMSNQARLEAEAGYIHQRLWDDFRPGFIEEHITDPLDRAVKSVGSFALKVRERARGGARISPEKAAAEAEGEVQNNLARRVSQMLKPEQLYVTAFLTAVELQSILRRIYY